MLKRLLTRLIGDASSPLHITPPEVAAQAQPQARTPAPGPQAAAPAENAAEHPLMQGRRLVELSMAGLHAQRQALDRRQRETFDALQDLQAQCQAVVARYANARLAGRPTELQALERQYDNFKSRLQSAELRHADQLSLLKLLDQVCVMREDLQARQGLQQDALAGLGLDDLKDMLGQELGALLNSRSKVQDLLDEPGTHDDDARLQAVAAMRGVQQELMALTEDEVQRAVAAQLQPMSDLSGQVQQRIDGTSSAARSAAARQPVSPQREGV